MSTSPFEERKRTPPILMLYAIYLYYRSLGLSAAKGVLEPFIDRGRSRESIRRWLHAMMDAPSREVGLS